MKMYLTILLFLFNFLSYADDTCSRLAIINQQEVLIDSSYSQRGEGLRFHLEKDPIASKYLNKYQDGTRIKWQNAAIGTIGTILLLAGVLTNSNHKEQTTLLASGASIMAVNFFIAKTMNLTNERNLHRSIEEYNKRNLPKIYFDPDQAHKTEEKNLSFMMKKSWSF